MAIVNNYDCVILDGGNGTTVWPIAGFHPKSPFGYPDCFFNLQAVAFRILLTDVRVPSKAMIQFGGGEENVE
jgi:hypothetical protein